MESLESNYLYSLQPYLPSLPPSPSLKWVILAMALTGHGLDFDLCSCEAQIKDSIYCCFMAAGMMNGAVSRSNQASVSLPHILIAKVASHRSALLPSPSLPSSSFLCFSAHCLSLSLSFTLNNVPLSLQNVRTASFYLIKLQICNLRVIT